MIAIDLISGFLGAGKTTFILSYGRYLLAHNNKIGIITNDYSSINVDALLLNELNSDHCLVEQIVGGYNLSDYKRRLKAKLIAFKMQQIDRVIIEPSGLFDVDTLFDVIADDIHLNQWYQINNIITVVDLSRVLDIARDDLYPFISQIIVSGSVVYTHLDLLNESEIKKNICRIKKWLMDFHSFKKLDVVSFYKNVNLLSDEDYFKIASSEYSILDIDHQNLKWENYDSFFILDCQMSRKQLYIFLDQITGNKKYGHFIRIKGFLYDKGWYSVNYIDQELHLCKVKKGQDVIIFIGHHLNEKEIQEALNDVTRS